MSKQFLTFAIIGVLNTLTDVALFVGLYDYANTPLLLANIVSTSVALSLSYVLNARYTFSDNGPMTRRRLVHFLAVTLSGVWILQPILIAIGLYILTQYSVFYELISVVNDNPLQLYSTIAKLASVPFTLAWNFLLYRKFVFRSE